MAKVRLQRERMLELFEIDFLHGQLVWKARGAETFASAQAGAAWNARYAGEPAGFLDRDGYVLVRADGRDHRRAAIIFYLFHGYAPPEVDHINRVKHDDRIANLRAANRCENMHNVKRRVGVSGLIGVKWRASRGKWVAAGRDRSGVIRYLGHYTNPLAAAMAYDEFVRKERGGFALPNFASYPGERSVTGLVNIGLS